MAKRRKTVKIFSIENPKSVVSEAFRTLRTNIQYSNIDKKIKTIVVTSSKTREGKSTVSANLAYSIAESGKRVLIIDCDLRKPVVHKILKISNTAGLTNVLIGESKLSEVLQVLNGKDNMHILCSGPIPPNPAELLGSNRMKDLLEFVKESYDMIILDSPPIGLVTDSAIISTLADGTILVIDTGETEIDVAIHAKELLDKVNARIIGVVLNKIPIKGNKYYNYSYYQYNEYYGEEEEVKGRKRKRR